MAHRLRLFFTVLSTFVSAEALAAVDPLCGQTITSDLTLTHDVDCISYTGNAITIGADNVTIDGAGFKIMAPDASAAIFATGRNNVTIRNVDVSGWCGGAGIHLDTSTNAVIQDVRADSRDYGVRLRSATTPSVVGLLSDGVGNAALSIETLTGVPTLSGLVLENATTGFYLSGSNSNFTLDNTHITSLSGSLTGLALANVSNLTVRNLTLDNPITAIAAMDSNNTSLTFRDLTLSGLGSGTSGNGGVGLALQGANHTVRDVIANDRRFGVQIQTFTNLTLDGITASRAGDAALYLRGTTLGVANALTWGRLELHDSETGLFLDQIVGPSATPLTVTPAIGNLSGNRRGLRIVGSRYLDVSAWSPVNLASYTVAIHAFDQNNQNLRFTNLDLSSENAITIFVESTGLQLAGANHTIQTIVAHGRRRGVFVGHSSLQNLIVNGVTASDSESALYIEGVALSPTNSLTVTNVACTRCIAPLDINNLDGQASAPFVIDPMLLTGLDSAYSPIRIRGGSSYLTVRGAPGNRWALPGLSAGVDAQDGSSTNLVFEYLNVSGPGYGNGITIAGNNHTLRDIVSNDRVYGVQSLSASNLTVETLSAAKASAAAFSFEGTVAVLPTLSGLSLTQSARGLNLNNVVPPSLWTLTAAPFTSFADSLTAIELQGSTTNVKLTGLTLPNRRGVRVASSGGSITLDNLVLDGVGLGNGAEVVNSPNVTITNSSANNRATGFSVSGSSNLTLQNVTARGCSEGLSYSLTTGTSPTFSGVDLRDNRSAVVLAGSGYTFGPATPGEMAAVLDITGSRIGLYLNDALTNVTLRNLRLAAREYGIRLHNLSPINLVLQGVDASGTGQGVGFSLSGTNLTLTSCVANDRSTGLALNSLHQGTVTSFTSRRSGIGIDIGGAATGTSTPPTLAGLDVRDSAVGLQVAWNATAWTLNNSTVALNAANTLIGIQIKPNVASSNLTFDGFVLPSRAFGLAGRVGASNITVRNCDLSGSGLGTGLVLNGTNLTVQNVTADHRAVGANLSGATGVSINGLLARHVATGLDLTTIGGALTLSDLTLEDAAPGLNLSGYAGTLALDTTKITSLAGSYPAITVATSPSVTVDAAGLGLTGPTSGSWYTTLPANSGPQAALCGTTLSSSTTLTADLHCTAVSGTALTLGNGVTLDGAGFKIVAPHASTVVAITGTGSTLKNTDISGTRPTGTGVDISGSNATVQGVTSSLRDRGVYLHASGATLTNVTAAFARSQALYMRELGGAPVNLSGLSLTDSTEGLRLYGSGANADPGGGDLVIDPDSITSLANNATSVVLNVGTNYRLEDLTLDGWTAGLWGDPVTSSVAVSNVNLSQTRVTGTGLSLAGSLVTLSGLTASRRATGFGLADLVGWMVDGLVATECDTGLSLTADFDTANPSLASLDLRRNQTALSLWPGATSVYTFTGAQFVTPLDGRRENLDDIQVHGEGTAALTFSNLAVDGLRTGLYLARGAHTLNNIAATSTTRGDTGVHVFATEPTVVNGLTISGYATGLNIANGSAASNVSAVAISRALTAGLSLGLPAGVANHKISGVTVATSMTGIHISGSATTGASEVVGAASGALPATGRLVVTALNNNDTDIRIQSLPNATVRDLTLSGTTAGLIADNGNAMHQLVVRDVTSEPPAPGGTGVSIGGNGQTLERVTTRYRNIGATITGGVGHTVETFVAERSRTHGLYLVNLTPTGAAPLSLHDIRLSGTGGGGGVAALFFNSVDTTANPLTLDPSTALVVATNMADLRMAGATRKLTVDGLALSGWQTAISAASSSNQNLTFANLDLLGTLPFGTGLELSGSGHVLTDLQANRRETGFLIETGTTGLIATDLTANAASHGVYYRSATPPTTLQDIVARNTRYALRVANVIGPYTLSPASLSTHDFTGTQNDLTFEGTSNLTVDGFTLRGLATGLTVNNTSSGMTLRNLGAATTAPGGTGVTLGGSGHNVSNLIIKNRQTGLSITTTTAVTIDGAVLTGNTSAVAVAGQTSPLTLRNLAITESSTGLEFTDTRGTPSTPLVFDGASMGTTSFTRTISALSISNASRFLEVRNQKLPGLSFGATLGNSTTGIALTNLDVSRGAQTNKLWCTHSNLLSYGVSVSGHGHTLTNTKALGRRLGIAATTAGTSSTGGLIAASTFSGVDAANTASLVSTTVVANGANTATTFQVASTAQLVAGRSLVITLGTGPEVRRVLSTSGNNLTLESALSSIPAAGNAVQSQELNQPRLTVTATDICANKSGATVGTLPTVLGGNHWRTQLGPVHGTNPGGTGDIVIGTGTDVSVFEPIPFDIVNPYCNAEPIPNAGPDASICEGELVTLDGSGTTDPDGDPLTFAWTLEDGQWVGLDGNNAMIASFTAPTPTTAPTEALTLRLTVDDGDQVRADDVIITVHTRNMPPSADAGADLNVAEGDTVLLSGSGDDNEGTNLSYQWVQVSGPAVTLSGANTASPSFVAPQIGIDGSSYSEVVVLRLTVTDELAPDYCGTSESESDDIEIAIENINNAPEADAGADQSVDHQMLVTLDATGSFDLDGDTLSYSWSQISGTSVTLSDEFAASPTFTAPTLLSGSEVLAFILYVSDGYEGYDVDFVEITVNATCTPVGPDTTCDGVDDDCDGDTDEDYEVDTSCYLPGVCASGNTPSSCSNGVETACQTGSPSGTPESTCNGLDDDCDDAIDEDYEVDTSCFLQGACAASNVGSSCELGVETGCQTGTPSTETCDNIDNDCDGQIDEDLTQQTTCGQGACQNNLGTETCVLGDWTDDTCDPFAGAAAETCDNIDNDCDGTVDEDLTQQTTCGQGACQNNLGFETCVLGDWTNDTCDPFAGATAEACDNTDNDCDGAIDEDLTQQTTCGQGACQNNLGTETCIFGIWSNDTCDSFAGATAETCDNVDNDCDGDIDENLTQATTCGLGACESSVGEETCIFGTWSNDTCDPFVGATDETCDNIDNDCDGDIDEDLTQQTTCGQGACENSVGEETCIFGTWSNDTCDPLAGATDETCDNIDNDCDGDIDENLTQATTCGLGACQNNVGEETCILGDWSNDTCDPLAGATEETCDNTDNDCDGQVDEDLTQPTTCGQGACENSVGEETCIFGTWSNDTCDPLAGATDETCDNTDNDCDGNIDEDLTQPTSCGQGACQNNVGTETCVLGTWSNDTCDPFQGASAETCDNTDNDCDGQIDEDLPSDIVPCVLAGGCAGSIETICLGGQMVGVGECQIPDGLLDLCDGLDDDCDGQTDEDFAPEPAACGVDACAVGQGLTTCVNGVPGDTCEPLWSEIPDTTCGTGTTGQHVAYILVTDATGTLIGSIRCHQDLSGPNTPVTCDTDLTGTLIVYPELYCEGVAP